MLKLYLYKFKGYNIIKKKIFEVEEPSEKTAYCYIPKGMTYEDFHTLNGVYPPISSDLDIINEANTQHEYAMFSLENNDKKYEEKLREALKRKISCLEAKIAETTLDYKGVYKVFLD